MFRAWTTTDPKTTTEAAPGERFAVPTFTKNVKVGQPRAADNRTAAVFVRRQGSQTKLSSRSAAIYLYPCAGF